MSSMCSLPDIPNCGRQEANNCVVKALGRNKAIGQSWELVSHRWTIECQPGRQRWVTSWPSCGIGCHLSVNRLRFLRVPSMAGRHHTAPTCGPCMCSRSSGQLDKCTTSYLHKGSVDLMCKWSLLNDTEGQPVVFRNNCDSFVVTWDWMRMKSCPSCQDVPTSVWLWLCTLLVRKSATRWRTFGYIFPLNNLKNRFSSEDKFQHTRLWAGRLFALEIHLISVDVHSWVTSFDIALRHSTQWMNYGCVRTCFQGVSTWHWFSFKALWKKKAMYLCSNAWLW